MARKIFTSNTFGGRLAKDPFYVAAPPIFSPIIFGNMRLEKAENRLTKGKLLKIIQGLLRTDANLDFLLQLTNGELEVLVASIRERLDRSN